MESNNGLSVTLSFVSFVSSIVAIFVMYYVFTGIALVLGIATLKNERSRALSITSIIIVCITIVLKIIKYIVTDGNLPGWLTNGF